MRTSFRSIFILAATILFSANSQAQQLVERYSTTGCLSPYSHPRVNMNISILDIQTNEYLNDQRLDSAATKCPVSVPARSFMGRGNQIVVSLVPPLLRPGCRINGKLVVIPYLTRKDSENDRGLDFHWFFGGYAVPPSTQWISHAWWPMTSADVEEFWPRQAVVLLRDDNGPYKPACIRSVEFQKWQ